ncbi:hypothetical protein GGI23_000297 [Coemansia sp. RSA 2559]|nr:hypothetical protein GGI23_000297 [Coemansia sp. RSA 2559]
MNPEYRATARILSTSCAPTIVSETTHDLLVRSTAQTDAYSLLHLGQYVTTLRLRTARDERERQRAAVRRNFVDRAAYWAFFSGMVGRSGANELDANTVSCIEAIVVAADNQQAQSHAASLALVGGVVLALVSESARQQLALIDRCAALFVRLACGLCEAGSAPPSLLVACAEVVPVLNALERLRVHVNRLAAGGVLGCVADMLPAVARAQTHADAEQATRLLCALLGASATAFDEAWRVVQVLHGSALEALLEQEKEAPGAQDRSSGGGSATDRLAFALLHGVEAVLQRFFLEDAYQRVPKERLFHAWGVLVDTMGLLHFSTLRSSGREGSEVFRRASTLAVQFMAAQHHPPALVDAAVRQMFVAQPCLAFMAAQPVAHISAARSCLVLFYIDLLEHLVPHVRSAHTLDQLVVPLAARYADAEALQVAGPEWFESAHALLLAVLEEPITASDDVMAGSRTRMVLEIAPWYADLVLGLYPDRGISAELLRIAYAAAVRAANTRSSWQNNAAVDAGQTPAWTLVCKLLSRLDALSAETGSDVRMAVERVRRRELLLVLAGLLATLPLELLPRLMSEMRARLLAERDAASRKAVDDEIQQVVLAKADVTRKFALSTWAWRLHSDTVKAIKL